VSINCLSINRTKPVYNFPSDDIKKQKWFEILDSKNVEYSKETKVPLFIRSHFNEKHCSINTTENSGTKRKRLNKVTFPNKFHENIEPLKPTEN
jgi:hypothetical protein